MKIEITNDIRAKVFAAYLGQEMYCSLGYENCTLELLNFISKRKTEEDRVLVLRPMSEITDEDAVLLIMVDGANCYYEIEITERNHRGFNWTFEYASSSRRRQRAFWWTDLSGQQSQFLQSRGYDVPHYLLGGQTLYGAGLAIYPQENETCCGKLRSELTDKEKLEGRCPDCGENIHVND